MLKLWTTSTSWFAVDVRNCCISLNLLKSSSMWVSCGTLGSLVPSLGTANLDNPNIMKTLLCQQELHKLCLADSPTDLIFTTLAVPPLQKKWPFCCFLTSLITLLPQCLCIKYIYIYIYIYIFIYLVALGLSCSMWIFSLQHVGVSLVVVHRLQRARAQ